MSDFMMSDIIKSGEQHFYNAYFIGKNYHNNQMPEVEMPDLLPGKPAINGKISVRGNQTYTNQTFCFLTFANPITRVNDIWN
jgi:hypothetical protein